MNTNDLFNAVMQLDLEPIKMKLMHVESGEGWSLDKANAVEKEYRRFLCLMKLYPAEDTAPLVDVDTFWHYHILDTMKYAVDCEQVFGYFLHHYPYVGMRGEDDEQFRLDSGDRMRDLYEATFGETYPGVRAAAATSETAWCAGPHIDQATQRTGDTVAAGTAWCAGPHIDKVTQRAGDVAAAGTAWCAGPHIDKEGKRAGDTIATGTAWCAGPHIDKVTQRAVDTIDAATAWCAGPHIDKVTQRAVDTTGAATAWCAGPHIDKAIQRAAGTTGAATAWCAGPHIDKAIQRAAGTINAGTAWCAGPHAASKAAAAT